MSFAIVEWLDETQAQKEVSVVPTNWLILNDGDLQSFWPVSGDGTKLVKSRCKPKDTWQKFLVRQLGKAGKN
jgi:hypothetical protein